MATCAFERANDVLQKRESAISKGLRTHLWYGKSKGAIDCALALVVLILAAPFFLLAAVLVKLTSRGPVIYSQVRLGRGGKPFYIYKIRSMVHDCERHSGAQWSQPGDARVTPVGRFLRKSHIDELPQLWNVLRGDMSLVGPRPERPEFVHQLEKALDRYEERMLVRPGITGLAQVQLPPDSDLDSVRRKLAHDLCYVEQMSFWLDFRIMMRTALNLCGLGAILPRWILALPGGVAVEQGYQARLTAQEKPDSGEMPAVVLPAPAVVPQTSLLSDLQPA